MPEETRFDSLMDALNSEDELSPEPTPETALAPTAKPKSKRAKSKDPSYKQIGLYLPADVHQRMKIGSAITGLEMSAIAQAGIEMWLAENVPNT